MKSKLFHTNDFKAIEKKIKDFLNSQSKNTLGIATNTSVRTSGDQIPSVIKSEISNILGKPVEFPESRKSMYNFSFSDEDKLKYHVNVVTHRIETKFNMPNITSVDRLIELYKNDKNYFIILMISYEASKSNNYIKEVHFKPIDFFSWDCLGLGALGVGQIQIKKAKHVVIIQNYSRKAWMIDFSDRLNDFYINEAKKIVGRLDKASKLKKEWKVKKDIWLLIIFYLHFLSRH